MTRFDDPVLRRFLAAAAVAFALAGDPQPAARAAIGSSAPAGERAAIGAAGDPGERGTEEGASSGERE